ncbi:MAG: HU family DNA-binding protein [Prevotellaceae bacterium]|jgi:nucleoid DNA-binding protein/nucleoid-associated protein YgaU|nr:HU family DNA-binding protein [Prevotellaceae bacterium]
MKKLNLQEFVGQVARQTGWTKKESDELLRTFLSVVTDGLETDNQVKVKGLGTFKRVWIAPRQSVNIKSGEKFEIAGHYKLSFTPENELKELINKSYAHLATTYVDEEGQVKEQKPEKKEAEKQLDLSKLSNEAKDLMVLIEEIKAQNKSTEPTKEKSVPADEYVAEEEETPNAEEPNEEVAAVDEYVEEETVEQQGDTAIEQILQQVRSVEKPATKTAAARAKVAANVAVATTIPVQPEMSDEEEITEKKGRKKRRRGCGCAVWLGVFGLLLLAAVLVYYFLFAPFKINLQYDIEEKTPHIMLSDIQTKVSGLMKSFNKEKVSEGEYIDVLAPTDTIEIESDTIDILSDTLALQNKAAEENPPLPAGNLEPEYLAEVEVGVGDNLMRYAYQYYGHTMFWVYIYEANKDRIANPDNVHLGTKLRIPNLSADLIDLSNPETELRVSQLKRDILK